MNASLAAGQRLAELRRWPRYPVSLRAEGVVLPEGRDIAGGISVLSRGGCYFRTIETQPAGSLLRVRAEFRGRVFESWARVVHAIPADGMGVAFLDTQESQIAVLTEWLEEFASQDVDS